MRSAATVRRRCVGALCLGVAAESQQRTKFLYTSLPRSTQFPQQWVVPKSTATNKFRSLLRSRYGAPVERVTAEAVNAEASEKVDWEDAEGNTDTGADVLAKTEARAQQPAAATPRPYVPLGEVAKVELRGDYLTEAGMGQEALEHYGVAMAAYEAAYPQHHNQIAKMRIKLARALRMTGRTESAIASATSALTTLDNVPGPQVEHIVEALLELGEAHLARKEFQSAGEVFEDSLAVLEAAHDIGASHRQLRQLKLVTRRLCMHAAAKFVHYSPYEADRVFAIVDTALQQAEHAYDLAGDKAGATRALEARTHLTDRKWFNMRDYAFKMRMARGVNGSKGKSLSARPSATELLAFTPTLHQPVFDYSALSTAPLGKEHLVSVGANAKVLDDGDPTRFITKHREVQQRRQATAREYVQKHWAGEAKRAEGV
uniref:Uncharacterized protein n=1 Tax=Neobodo designis TaxID=312471 RepID=A0A7S1W239_NEODS|mmetsp:Transcript_49562/g.152992  ORF Transcript_49562/g.152992 Transcript_49562/m.152992 type:complete len:430 (+) Transcript_49562:41-1330(+)|eukprot:CAMPEP_0174853858 /NCGR_PEP_ID=MMETSP1114-20130205/29609_1 /TAXON_ID=312471 /ORGANISM="Neobodo designis, Strain CCAP 1951/1" /LENGTH=429 /DNA_ID=CAMNT_0016088527 /DNA_START=41 /DNA_END=1330 /DNA_ORIENTATION=+